MAQNWIELSAMLAYRGDYKADVTDRHYQATEPLEPELLPVRTARSDLRGSLLEVRSAGAAAITMMATRSRSMRSR